jgi:hypothetical protein
MKCTQIHVRSMLYSNYTVDRLLSVGVGPRPRPHHFVRLLIAPSVSLLEGCISVSAKATSHFLSEARDGRSI